MFDVPFMLGTDLAISSMTTASPEKMVALMSVMYSCELYLKCWLCLASNVMHSCMLMACTRASCLSHSPQTSKCVY